MANLIKTNDLSQCDKARGIVIQGIDYEVVCRNNVAFSLATLNLDITECQKLDDALFPIIDCERAVRLRRADAGSASTSPYSVTNEL